MHSVDRDMRYMVYRWEFFCLYYPLKISISWIYLLSSYNWFCRFCTSHHLMPLSCSGVYAHDIVFNTWFWFEFIDICVHIPVCHLTFITPLVGEFLTPLNLHVQISELRPWWTSSWSEWHSRSIVDQRRPVHDPILPGPSAHPSRFPCITHEGVLYIHHYISLCILAFALVGDVIFM